MVELTKENYKQELQSGLNVLKIYGDNCPACRMVNNPIASILKNFNTEALAINTTHEDINEELNIHTVPTILIFNNGMEMRRFVGINGEKSFNLVDFKNEYTELRKQICQ